MEMKEFKRTISIYDSYSINELIEAKIKAEKEIENFNKREAEIKAEKKAKGRNISEEEKEEFKKKIDEVKAERKPIKEYFNKLNRKKTGLLNRIDKAITKLEEKNSKIDEEIAEAKNKIAANEEKITSLDTNSEEYKELEEQNKQDKKNVASLEKRANKNIEKSNRLLRLQDDVINDNPIEGVQQRKIISYKIVEEERFTNSENSVKNIVEIERADLEENELDVPDIEQDDVDTPDIEEPENTEPAKVEEEPVKKVEAEDERAKIEEELRKSAIRMKEYKETGNYNQEALEHEYYNSLVSKLNNEDKEQVEPEKEEVVEAKRAEIIKEEPRIETPRQTRRTIITPEVEATKTAEEPKNAEPVKTEEPVKSAAETEKKIAELEEEIKKSAARMKEYKETGNYNQEALEHEYYNSLISKLYDLKTNRKEDTEKSEISEIMAEEVDLRGSGITSKIKTFFGKAKNFIKEKFNNFVRRIDNLDRKVLGEPKKEEKDSKSFVEKVSVNEKEAIKAAEAKTTEKEEMTK